MLKKLNISSKLILDKVKFKWADLFEIKEFDKALIKYLPEDKIIHKETLNNALNEINYLSQTKNFYYVKELTEYIKRKENFNYEAWRALLEDLDDDFFYSKTQITISTIHKSKGKEFSNVIIKDEANNHNN